MDNFLASSHLIGPGWQDVQGFLLLTVKVIIFPPLSERTLCFSLTDNFQVDTIFSENMGWPFVGQILFDRLNFKFRFVLDGPNRQRSKQYWDWTLRLYADVRLKGSYSYKTLRSKLDRFRITGLKKEEHLEWSHFF